MPRWNVMPLWTTVYLRGNDRQRILAKAGVREERETGWSDEARKKVHHYIVGHLRNAVVEALREFTGGENESEEQLLLAACFSATERGPNSLANAQLYEVPMRAALAELRRCLGEQGYDEAVGLQGPGPDMIYTQILGAMVIEDPELRQFMARRFPGGLV